MQDIRPAPAAAPAGGRHKPSAILRSSDLDRARPHVERAAALALLLLSIAGCALAFGGGWPGVLTAPLERPLLGVAAQAICTLVEWLYRHNRWSVLYVVAFGFDAGSTIWGLGPLAAPGLTAVLAGSLESYAVYAAWCIIVVLACALAWVPEGRLVD